MESSDTEFISSGSSDIDVGDSAKHHQPESALNLSGLREQLLEDTVSNVGESVYHADEEDFSQESEHSTDTEDFEGSDDSDDSEDLEKRLMEEAMNAPLPDSDDDFDEVDEQPSSSEARPPAVAADGRPRRYPIVYKSHHPTEYRQHFEIAEDGTRKNVKTFFNSARKAARRDVQLKLQMGEEDETEFDEEQSEMEDYAGLEFTGRDFEGVELDPPRRPEPREYQPRPYRHQQYRGLRDRQHMRYIPCTELLNTEDAEALLKDASRFEFIDAKFSNQHQFAIPDELIWTTLGANEEYMPMGYVCPVGKVLKHQQYTKEEWEQERSRNGLVYQLICENGPLHVEDLWKALLNRMKRDPYPFDGFFGFYRFISDRSHIFRLDDQRLVYNQNLLITVAVMRYAHSLYHGTPIEMTPKLFKSERGSLFFRAFLSTSTRDELSFDRFLPSFPAIFKYDEEWKLNTPSVNSIPSVFDPLTLPRRERFEEYVDRSIIFSGTGKVVSNNLNKIKLESEETLRKGMSYLVFAPAAVVGNQADLLPVGTRVSYTGVRCYNGSRFSVKATSIAPYAEGEKDDFDGTEDDVFSCDAVEVQNPVEMINETPSTVLRMLDERSKMAEREKDINEALLKGDMGDGQSLAEMWNRTWHLFNNDFVEFHNHILFRPFYFKPVKNGQNYVIRRRSHATTKAMIELLGELEGKEGRSVRKDEAKEMHATQSLTLDEEDQFTFDDLSDVLVTNKMLFTDNGKPRLVIAVRPIVHWDPENKVMMKI